MEEIRNERPGLRMAGSGRELVELKRARNVFAGKSVQGVPLSMLSVSQFPPGAEWRAMSGWVWGASLKVPFLSRAIARPGLDRPGGGEFLQPPFPSLPSFGRGEGGPARLGGWSANVLASDGKAPVERAWNAPVRCALMRPSRGTGKTGGSWRGENPTPSR